MNDDELKEFGRMTLHGCPPMATVMKIYAGAMRLMEERDQAHAGPDGAWMIVYEDDGVKPEVFMGSGSEKAARAVLEVRRQSWSCHLFARVTGTIQPQMGSYAPVGGSPT